MSDEQKYDTVRVVLRNGREHNWLLAVPFTDEGVVNIVDAKTIHFSTRDGRLVQILLSAVAAVEYLPAPKSLT